MLQRKIETSTELNKNDSGRKCSSYDSDCYRMSRSAVISYFTDCYEIFKDGPADGYCPMLNN